MKKAIVALFIMILGFLLASLRLSETLTCTGELMTTRCERVQKHLFWQDAQTIHIKDLNSITLCNDLREEGSDYSLCATNVQGQRENLISLPEKDVSYAKGVETEMKALRLGAETTFHRDERNTTLIQILFIFCFAVLFALGISRRR